MSTEPRLSIGAFALVSGLSIPALRHYDEVGLLKPAEVDPVTGYRRYRSDQLAQAQLIRALRGVDVPVDAIKAMIADATGEDVRDLLTGHRERLKDRAGALSELLCTVDQYIEGGVPVGSVQGCRIVQIRIGVDSLPDSIAFYEATFGVTYDEGYCHFQFGTWPSDQFFLLTLDQAETDSVGSGRSSFGFLVDDLDAVHQRALEAGATELEPPNEIPGQPRTSCLGDPSDNKIFLYQG